MKQQMQMSPQMLQSLSIMTMPAAELREYIYDEADKNPALEISADRMQDCPLTVASIPRFSENTRIAENHASDEKSDLYQAFIESAPAPEQSLQDSLLQQLGMIPLDEHKRNLCERLIQNLNDKGFYSVPPQQLLHPQETEDFLNSCISIVQSLDPCGICCTDTAESLLIQARHADNAPPLALYILNGHLELLSHSRNTTVLKQLQKTAPKEFASCTEDDIEEARQFIRSLDPYPARQFGSSAVRYAVPDIRVERVPVTPEEEEELHRVWQLGGDKIPVLRDSNGNAYRFAVFPIQGILPELAVASDFESFAAEEPAKNSGKEQRQFIKTAVTQAQAVITAVEQRTQTLLRVAQAIVNRQTRFFEQGPLYLAPLKQHDIADVVGLHETTVSRAVNGKWLQCSHGIFELRSFFSSRVPVSQYRGAAAVHSESVTVPEVSSVSGFSRESVKLILKQIIEEYEQTANGKPLSDSKLTELLEQKGVKIARRTVAKYRAELNIDSSFKR